MQDTRLNRLFDIIFGQLETWVYNPWRRTSVLLISVLFGNYLATAVALIAGQLGELDVVVAAALMLQAELISWLTYRRRVKPGSRRPFFVEMLNALKIGVSYGFAVEAFKLGS